ncbi:DUF6375 family protein [Pantoea agglomerans]|uniref:Uncharacterized protein n=1 Tax=Paramixta manurensis TaxID=2740817 RepID=A0A6M8UIP5_9GAMM|nr:MULTISPECIES: DUF6375 family protein [Enterobacterales]QKJ88287.1 hypothetical protein PMPD1_3364 [Erwiniaceae bacterium PD-1]ASN85259.1 Hypothetical protein SCC1_1823 [Pectobacterium versatile]MBQ4762356.1 hypothetical protein [Pectobacterium versatile]MBZ7269226.1 hypothetical protein [Klebsiella michiganensis]MCL6371557.1 hypothetical protein [Pectobacterium atrosepticum]
MKIWNGYGSEHSMNLVLIGKFKQEQDAEKVEKDIKTLSTQAEKDECYSIPFDEPENQRFSDEMLSLLYSLKLHTLGPTDLGQLVSDHHLDREGDRITITTDEAEVSAFVKLFVEAGAKVEIFSAHDYPSDSNDAS